MSMSLKQLLKLSILPIKRRKYNLRHQEGRPVTDNIILTDIAL